MSTDRGAIGSPPSAVDHEIVLRDPQSVLRRKLGPELRVLDFQSDSFLKAGDNYGSTIFKVRARIRRCVGAEPEELQMVAKMLPAMDHQRAVFESAFTFKKEIFIYEELVPLYRSIWARDDFDVVPECYGSALSSLRDDAVETDEDAVILLENLNAKGYYMADRHKGLDRDHVKAAAAALAKFHAIGLSVKHKQPSRLADIQRYAKPLAVEGEAYLAMFKTVVEALTADPATSAHIDRILPSGNPDDFVDTYFLSLEPDDPWACLVHSDFWVNNALFHRDAASGRVDDCKLVDFQLYRLSSPLTDLLFLLCTSMERSLGCFDEMLEFYRERTLEILRELRGCGAELFERRSFEERLKLDAGPELYHILLMSKVVEVNDGEDLIVGPVNEACIARLRRIVEIFAEKKWI